MNLPTVEAALERMLAHVGPLDAEDDVLAKADGRTLASPVTAGRDQPPFDASAMDGWAVRDVYDGVAVLEDRRRRLVEVGRGDAVPGIGRVEAIERRGRQWVVVTRQGIITPQAW